MLGFYNYTVVLTYIGMLAGFFGIVAAANDNLKMAVLCLMACGICDMFDGKIAATRERTVSEKQFGIQIDSLSDLICFGVLPAMIVYRIRGAALWLCALYVLCALIRLSWFNVDEMERQANSTERRSAYLGLPVTTAAAIFPLLVGLCNAFRLPLRILAPIVLAITGLCFLIPFHLPKPQITRKLILLLCGCVVIVVLLVRL